jgi:hypothetical protein
VPARSAFLISVHVTDETAVLENLATRERVRIYDLSDVGQEVKRWLGSERSATGVPRREGAGDASVARRVPCRDTEDLTRDQAGA